MYNIKMVSKLLGISPGTIRAWENRYSVVHPTRTEGGHRLYSDEDVEDLRWLHEQTSVLGLGISQAAQLLKKRKESALTPIVALNSDDTRANYARMQSDLYDHLVHLDIEKANLLVNLGFTMFQLEEMFHKVLVPLMIRVGDEWESGILSVAQEHMISEFVKQRFMQFFGLFQINPSLPKVIAACSAGEHHEMGLLLFSLYLRRKGLEVIYLGADNPIKGIAEMINRHVIQYLCLSLSDTSRLDPAVDDIDYVLESCPHVKIVLGGTGFQSLALNPIYKPMYEDMLIGDDIEQWESWYQRVVAK